jgi:hypothetical protein
MDPHVHRDTCPCNLLSHHGLINILTKHTLDQENRAWEDFVDLPLPFTKKLATPEEEMREVII